MTSSTQTLETRFFVVYMALFAPFAVLTPYLQQLLHLYGFRHDQIGYIQGAVELTAVLAPPFWGLLSDRLRSPRGILALTILLALPAFMLFSPGLTTPAAMLIAFLFGFFCKPSIPLTDGMTFAYFQRLGGDYGHVRIGGTISFIACCLVFERFVRIGDDPTGQRITTTFAVLLGVQACSLLLLPAARKRPTTAAPDPTSPGPDRAGGHEALRLFLQPGFIAFMLAGFLARFAMMSYYSFFSRYLNEVYDFRQVGYIWLLGSVCEFPLIFWSRRIMARIGVRNLFALGLLGTVVRLLGFGIPGSLWTVIAMQPLHMLTFGAFHCASVTYVSRSFPNRLQGSAQGICFAVTVGLGSFLGSAVGGVVLEHWGYVTLYLSFAALAAVAFLVCILFVPKLEKQTP
jgi:PPP family 3-phenylpropionic acid transporter